jgi:ATP/maltotriose-dependent transcriptional regulator MalT
LQESLALCTQVGDRWGMGTAYRFLGLAALAQGDAQAAQTLLRKSLDVFAEFVIGWDIVQSLIYLGEAAGAAGDLAEARRILLDARAQARAARTVPLELDALVALAELQMRTGAVPEALEAAAFVLRHPLSMYEAKERARHIYRSAEVNSPPPIDTPSTPPPAPGPHRPPRSRPPRV